MSGAKAAELRTRGAAQSVLATGWRGARLKAADAITAHIRDHDDHPGTPGRPRKLAPLNLGCTTFKGNDALIFDLFTT
jgi:hypothetical protein